VARIEVWIYKICDNEPVLPPEWRALRGKGLPAPQAFELGKERQPARRMSLGEADQEEPSEQAGEHPHG
jgi:hypothetical protein